MKYLILSSKPSYFVKAKKLLCYRNMMEHNDHRWEHGRKVQGHGRKEVGCMRVWVHGRLGVGYMRV